MRTTARARRRCQKSPDCASLPTVGFATISYSGTFTSLSPSMIDVNHHMLAGNLETTTKMIDTFYSANPRHRLRRTDC